MLVAFIRRQRTLAAAREATTTAATRAPSARRAPKKAPAPDAAYAPAFARVRLVRAWIGVAAATVALGYAFAALLDRVLP
jgi:hypothetical protein